MGLLIHIALVDFDGVIIKVLLCVDENDSKYLMMRMALS